MTIGVLLLVLPVPIGWASTLLLHALLNTKFWVLSNKDKLIHLLSTTWVTVPVRRIEERDQRHKGREIFLALLLAGINLVGTSAAMVKAIQLEQPEWFSENGLNVFGLLVPSLFLYIVGCGLMLFFEKSVHPWRQLGKEREKHCWGKVQGTTRGIEADPTFTPLNCDDSRPDFADNNSFEFLKWIPLQHSSPKDHVARAVNKGSSQQ